MPENPTIDSRRMLIFLLIMVGAAQIGLQGWMTLFNNFSVEMAGFTGFETGVVQSIREIPGFLALLAVYLLLIFREHRLLVLSLACLGLGVSLTGLFPSFGGIIFTTLVMSFGFHYHETMYQALTLQYFDLKTTPLVYGRLRSVMALTNIGVGLAIMAMSTWLNYLSMYLVLGVIILIAAVWGWLQDPTDRNVPTQRKKMILRRRYWLYYALTFLAGARRTILMAFAVFLMVKNFGFSVREVTALFIVNNLINSVANPMIGRAINRFGERSLLGIEYLITTLVFLVYAFSPYGWLVALAYIIDQIIFNFAMAINTYFQKIADPKDISPSMAVGFTINHIAAVFIPALGGILWRLDYKLVFFVGATLTLAALALTRFIPRKISSTTQ